jgi:hypothetical protein
MARALWLAIGLLATGLGIAGALLPLLPATPFLLVATYAFARSSPRLHAWLLSHPLMGPLIDDWRRYGAIGRKAKFLAMLVMAATLLFSVASGVAPSIIDLQAVLMGGAATFILTRPGRPGE